MNNKTIFGIIVGLFLTLIISIGYSRYLSSKLETSDHNLKVARDSVVTLTLKNGEHLSAINSYILEKKQLQEYLNISKEEVKELEKKLGKISYISKIESQLEYDTIRMMDTVYIDSINAQYTFSYNDDWLKLHGTSNIYNNIARTTIDDIIIPVPLQVGLTNDYKIWVKSQNPYLTITDIQGAVIEGSRINRKPKKWGLGIQAGMGFQYGLINKRLDVGPYVGIGISYNFINF